MSAPVRVTDAMVHAFDDAYSKNWEAQRCAPEGTNQQGTFFATRAGLEAALSAQPSPGGQGDAPSIDYEDLLDQAKDLIHCGCSVNGAFEWLLEQLTDGEALPARQPAVQDWGQLPVQDVAWPLDCQDRPDCR